MSEKYLDVTLPAEERARALLEEMTLDEKMAQVVTLFPFDQFYKDFETLAARMPFGIGEVSTLEMRRMETLEEVSAWQRRIQKIVMDNSPHHIPAIFHMEGLCGPFIQDTTSFPSGIARGSSFDPELEEEIAKIVARQETACGITHVLAPVLDISRDSRMGRQGEAYGEDPTLASALGVAYTRGIQQSSTAGRKIESIAKHYLGFHSSEGGIHGTVSQASPRLLEEIYGKPFQAAIKEAQLKGIMPCYNAINGEPASASYTLLTELLRDKMGFDGVCASDYGAVGNTRSVQCVGQTIGETGLICMEAGMDVEMAEACGFDQELKQMFASGEADIGILNQAVLRILSAKFRMGLFEHPFALEGIALRETVVKAEDREVSLRSARESMVLLKNTGVLPLRADVKKIAVIGPHADSARKFFGGYTHMCMMESVYAIANSIAGVSGIFNADPSTIVTVPGTNIQSDETPELDAVLRRQKPSCRSLLEELKVRMPETEFLYAYGYPIAGTDESRFAEALEAVKQADVVILTLGGKHGTCSLASMGEGVDATNINLPACQDSFIRRASALGKPMIGVHFDGRPISSDTADEYLDAILEAWSPAEAGAQAVTDVLLGVCDPGGRLPVSVARNAGQIPVYYNHPNGSAWHQSGSIGFANYVDLPHTPRYFFGYGLSYTRFAYSDLKISRAEIAPDEDVEIQVTITNVGDRFGNEIVQLYLRDEYASMIRPVKELAGFQRVTLAPGETKTVTFTVSATQTAFLDRTMRWKVEKGDIQVQVGTSSEDICLTGMFRITGDQWIESPDRVFYAKSKVSE